MHHLSHYELYTINHKKAITMEVWIKGNRQNQFNLISLLNFLNYISGYISFIFQNVVTKKEEKVFS